MRFLLSCSVAIATAVSSSVVAGQSMPTSWVRQQPPLVGSEALLCAAYTPEAWEVSQNQGALSVRSVKLLGNVISPELRERVRGIPELASQRPDASISSLSFGDGWLVGLDRGEFGGGLWWLSHGLGDYRRLTSEPVLGLLHWGERSIVLVGLAHMNANRGGVFEVTTDNLGGITLRTLADLKACPYAAHASRDRLVVATASGVVQVSPEGETRWLSHFDHRNTPPYSITALPSGTIYVGLQRYVVELSPVSRSHKETWFVPADCARFRIDFGRLECICLPDR